MGILRVAAVVAGLVIACCSAPAWTDTPAAETARPLLLEKAGEKRKLPQRLLGGSAEALIEHMIDDPSKVAALKDMAPAFVRFPGGSQANYYNWRTGLLDIEATDRSSEYTRFWVRVASKIRAAFPQGVSIQEYAKFNQEIGAEVVLVPNLETSSVAEQVAWFRRMKEEGIVPRWIELGNEFWIAMGFDPDVMKRWPDEPTSIQIMKRYADALRPFLPPGARVAVQSAGSAFSRRSHPVHPAGKRLQQWDEDLKPEPWFDAVTLHLYPRVDEIMGEPDSAKGFRQPEQSMRMFKALMARCDQGVDRVVDDTRRRLPGKEIWITEWNPRGGDYKTPDEPSPGMLAQLVSRMTFAFLRHQEVTMSLYFTFNFNRGSAHCVFYQEGQGRFAPVPLAVALSWFHQAANGGATYQRFIEAGGRAVPGGGVREESYLEVEAGLFSTSGRVTLIVQNCSPETRVLQIPRDLSLSTKAPSLVETLAAPDLTSTKMASPVKGALESGGHVQIPPYSLTRIVWTGTVDAPASSGPDN
jgi:hypothetical protein